MYKNITAGVVVTVFVRAKVAVTGQISSTIRSKFLFKRQ